MRSARVSSLAGGKLGLRALFLLVFGVGSTAWAGGPRFIPGQDGSWGVPAWNTVAWPVTTLRYYTDQGALSPGVDHATADAMVAAAAQVWNVPTSSLAFAQGGQLAEDVSSANTSFDGSEVVLPADVQSGNEGAIPVALVYDADGSVIDLLEGDGASDPEGCASNAVVGDVDDVHHADGTIAHALLILNGRCVGSAPEQLLQMQYQLTRAFGRILGISWSQTNDNVFTAERPISANQMAFWPLMHPLDVICGNYSYQCVPNPFQLRVDDLNTLGRLYPVYESAVPAGKQGTDNDALYFVGLVQFPTGQGMAWVNMTTQRNHGGVQEDWQTTSTMTGYEYEQASATPLAPTAAVDSGLSNAGLDAYFILRRIPLDGISDVTVATEAINPLYIGEAALGPYVRMPTAPSGQGSLVDYSALPNGDGPVGGYLTPAAAASSCAPGADGTEASPATTDPSGWQAGQLCAMGHNSWWSVPVAAGHSWTWEVTATDETGAAVMEKAMPVVGAWQATDPTGTTPTVAMAPVAFNSMSLGMTQMAPDAPATDTVYRVSVSDQYGAGRPDFTYTARLLYADHVSPAVLGTVGGPITITGTGFQQGMQVTVNGVGAAVLSATANEIVVMAPSMATAGTSLGQQVDVEVTDPATQGIASVPGALSYVVLPDVLRLVSAPAGVKTGETAAVPVTLRLLASDGLTPVSGAAVTLSLSSGAATLAVCQGQTGCTAATDAQGLLTTGVSGLSGGSVVITVAEVGGVASLQLTLQVTVPVRAVALAQGHYVAAGAADSWTMHLTATEDAETASAIPVQWTVSGGLAMGALNGVTGQAGEATLQVGTPGLAAGDAETVQACAWQLVCAEATLYGVGPAAWTPVPLAGAAQSVSANGSLAAFQVLITDGQGHPLEQAAVQVNQRVLGAAGVCTAAGRCPSVPVLTSSQTALVSDRNGLITVTPLQVNEVPQTVEVAVATGTQGFLALTLVKVP